jgi:predicted nucleic acid-binding protein
MTRYLLDTNHVSADFKRQPEILARIKPSPQVEFGIPLPAIDELGFMIFNCARIAQNAADMERVLAAFTAYPYDDGAAREFGRLKAGMRRAGRTHSRRRRSDRCSRPCQQRYPSLGRRSLSTRDRADD